MLYTEFEQNGKTVLMWAVYRIHKDIVDVLLCVGGIDVNAKDKVRCCVFKFIDMAIVLV